MRSGIWKHGDDHEDNLTTVYEPLEMSQYSGTLTLSGFFSVFCVSWLVMPRFSPEPKFEPKLCRTGPRSRPRFRGSAGLDRRSSLRFRQQDNYGGPVRTRLNRTWPSIKLIRIVHWPLCKKPFWVIQRDLVDWRLAFTGFCVSRASHAVLAIAPVLFWRPFPCT